MPKNDNPPTRRSKRNKCGKKDRKNENKLPPKKIFNDDDDDDDEEEFIEMEFEEFEDFLEMLKQKNPTPNQKYLNSLSNRKRKQLQEKERKLLSLDDEVVPLRYKILNSNLPDKTKTVLLRKIIAFEQSGESGSGYQKTKKYMDKLLEVPFGVYKELNVKKGSKNISNFFQNIRQKLNESIYGQTETKNKIIEVIGKWISNPKSNGNIIGLHGPPGVGKTTLIKKGLSEAIGVPMAFIPLGGCRNSSTLEGHDFTYEGSKNGKLVDILIENKCMNPIIFFDELDKVSNTRDGDDIIGILTHLIDFTQNDSISDKYFSDIEFDFSKCLFIFSFNDDKIINPILKDRITIISMKGFDKKEKIIIAKDYIINKFAKNIGIDINKINLNDDILDYIVEHYCMKEEGVRELERCIEALLMKVNMYFLTQDKSYVPKQVKINNNIIEFDKEGVKAILDDFYKKKKDNLSHLMIYS